MGPIPKGAFLTKGVGRHREKLTSFELALRAAGIAEFNLVRVKSIFPPNCKMLSQQEGLKYLTPGQIVFAVMSDNATNEPHRLIASSVGVALPSNPAQYGYLSEHHSTGETDQKAGDYAEDLAASMLATILGVDFDPNLSYDERKDIWRMSDKIVTTRNVTQSAIGDRDGLWTTVVTAAVFVNLPTNEKPATDKPATDKPS
jgi:arginine decarboxylase